MPYRTRYKLLAAGGLMVALAAVGCGGTAKPASDSGAKDQAVALTVCHSAVKQKVSAQPGSFQFASEQEKQTNYGFIITGSVTAKAQTGTGVSNHYVCSAEQNGSSWIAQGVTLSGPTGT
jgi:hypothetical protein